MESVENITDRTPPALGEDDIPNGHGELYARFNEEELNVITQWKRFREMCEGDQKFRENFNKGEITPEQHDFLQEVGVTMSLAPMENIRDNPEQAQHLAAIVTGNITLEQAPAEFQALVEKYPAIGVMARFQNLKHRMYAKHDDIVRGAVTDSAAYNAWRQRRIKATHSELGEYGRGIDHPVLAIELCKGCSVGCYFCAFDAPRLTNVYDYNVAENRQLFRDVSQTFFEVFGVASGHCLLYWSTEPQDNPNYIDFMKEYAKITGSIVCTSTARWKEDWIRSLINFYRPFNSPWPRISVLSRKIMHTLFKQFSPDEFRDVWILPQQKDGENNRSKVPGGRDKMLKVLVETKDRRDYGEEEAPEDQVLQGSIACVSGFLVNMVDKTIMLSSPCYTTLKNRYGYRVFANESFDSAEDFNAKIKDLIARKCILRPYPTMPMRFRDDFDYRAKEDGFSLVSPNAVHQARGNDVFKPLGKLLDRGDLNYRELTEILIDEHQLNPMVVTSTIQRIFDSGMLCELEVDYRPEQQH